jgi:hypothetical protein
MVQVRGRLKQFVRCPVVKNGAPDSWDDLIRAGIKGFRESKGRAK